MYNADTELLFPSRVIPALRGQRNGAWQTLIDQVLAAGPESLDHLAFVLLMVRLGGCATCNADSFRAMRGCTLCSKQTVRRFRGTDQDLLNQFQLARGEVEAYLNR